MVEDVGHSGGIGDITLSYHIKKKKPPIWERLCDVSLEDLLACDVIGNRKRVATFSATASEDLAAISSCHSFTEAVLVNALTVRGLECSFHCLIVIFLLFA